MHRKTDEAEPVLRLRADELKQRLEKLGLTTASEQARYLRLSKWTISRLMNGQHAAGERVIARILWTFPGAEIGDFFDLVDARDEAA